MKEKKEKEVQREKRKADKEQLFFEARLGTMKMRGSKKQGALEELKRIEEAWHHIGSKGVCNYIEKRIKELSGETK